MEHVIGYADFLRMIVALIFVLALILLALYLTRKYGKGWGFQHTPPSKRRLQILESLPVGPKQRLMIIRRDNKEHLLVIGQENATIIEKNLDISSNRHPQKKHSDKAESKASDI